MKLDLATIQNINLFEKITKAAVKQFLINNEVYVFIVEKGQASKAIGKKGQNIKRLSNLFKKRIKIVEFDDDVVQFVKNLIYPLHPESIEQQPTAVEITADTKTKGLLIGRDRRNLSFYNTILKRYFNTEIKVK